MPRARTKEGGSSSSKVGSQGGIGAQTGFCRAEDAAQGSWMLVHLAKVAIMFGLRSSGGSYEKMRSEYYLDVENPFCPQVGVSGVGFAKKMWVTLLLRHASMVHVLY